MSQVARLVDEILKRGGDLRADGANLKLSAVKPLPDSLISELREHKADVVAYLTGGRGAMSEIPNPPVEWTEGVAKLADMDAPGDWPEHKWQDTVRGIEHFLKDWGGMAHVLGWTTLDCFGAHKWAPRARVGSAGLALSMFVGDVALLLPDRAVIRRANGSRLTYRRSPPKLDVVPVWELGGR